jgi:hypothetical protein
MRPQMHVRGAKARLARNLEVPRQRGHDYFVAATQMSGAERMIRILLWLASREEKSAALPVAKPHTLCASRRGV